MRVIVTCINDATLHAVADNDAEVIVQLAGTPFLHILGKLRKGDALEIVGGNEHRGVITPLLVIYEPDLLVDVTTLCECLKPYGFHALNSLLARFVSQEMTWQMQLGNLVNEFFDECINESGDRMTEENLFMKAVKQSFRNEPLIYSAIDGIDAGFFYDARQQFHNVRETVRERFARIGIMGDNVLLEPQFLSPELGIQGRLDALSADRSTIIELKSGKADEIHGGKAKEEHELQMLLYKEIMHHTLKMAPQSIRNLLFYSRYPRLIPVAYTQPQVQQAIAVRNDIVLLERDIREGLLPQIIARLTENDFNTRHEQGRFYQNYFRPIITRFLQRMDDLPELEKAYFYTFTRFIAREQYEAKRTFAQTWRTALVEQEAEGTAVTALTLYPILDTESNVVGLRCSTPHDLLGINFRRGDSVMLFEQPPTDTSLNEQANVRPSKPLHHLGFQTQVFRCQITDIKQHQIYLSLSFKQRSERVFHLEKQYAIAPAYIEAAFSNAYRGLTALITAPDDRRALLLGKRQPRENEYFLLIGPPGTGKTNIYLRHIVRKHLQQQHTLLVMAHTNQAVDEICNVLQDECPDLYARIGNENSCGAPYRQRMMQHLATNAANRRELRNIVDKLHVITGTIAGISSHNEIFALKQFDLTIVDEASQVLEPQILPILARVGRFILIGDHKQLPAVVAQDRSVSAVNDPMLLEICLTNCANSYFERLHALQIRWGIDHITTATLHKQGRMHQELMTFVNKHFYGGILETIPLLCQISKLHYTEIGNNILRNYRNIFIDSSEYVSDCSTGHKTNHEEARIVASLINDIRHLYDINNMPFSPAKTIGVIVPFRAQITAIRSAITDQNIASQITIDTVERYQGSQRDIIIFNTVVTHPDMLNIISNPVILADGTEVDRKLNVALTRAREQFILVGHRPTLIRSTIYAALVEHLTASE